MNGGEEEIEDPELLDKMREQARMVNRKALGFAVVTEIILMIIPG